MKVRLAVVAVALLAFSTPAIGLDQLQQAELHAFLAVGDGDRHGKEQDYLGALVRYEAALKVIAKMESADPQWDLAVIKRSFEDCQLKIAATKPLAAFQLAQLQNEWSIDTAVMEGKDSWSALVRAQAKVTYLQVMQINHPELAKAGMGEGMKQAEKNVDALVDAMMGKAAPSTLAQ